MAAPRKSRRSTTVNVRLANETLNFQFDLEVPALNWWFLCVLIAAAILVWRPDLTDYFKAVISLIQV